MTGHRIEPLWDAQLALAATIALDATLPSRLVLDARWVVPVVCGLVLAALMASRWLEDTPRAPSRARRMHADIAFGLIVVAHVGSLVALLADIIDPSLRHLGGPELLRAAGQLWVATVLLFGVLYWRLDRGGPIARSGDGPVPIPPPAGYDGPWPDFLFPQMADDAPAPRNWMPTFVDYLYVASTNSTAYSPTDTMPLTRTAKMLMMLQSSTAFVLFALVLGRAVSLLG